MGYISSEETSQSGRSQWIMTEVRNNITREHEYDSIEECIEDSCDSLETLSSIGTVNDTSSSSSSSSSVWSNDGPLYELSELMAHLPIKRGLSKCYQGKSQSFGSLANLKSFEDLAKRSRRSTKSSFKSCQSQTLKPKGTIVKSKRNPFNFRC